MIESLSGAEFKKQLREGRPKLGLFLNAHTVRRLRSSWHIAAMTGCWSIRSTDLWDMKRFRGCLQELRTAAQSRW